MVYQSICITSKFIYLGLLLLLHGGQPLFLDNKETSSRISMTVANDGLVEGTVHVQSSINLHKITICCQHKRQRQELKFMGSGFES